MRISNQSIQQPREGRADMYNTVHADISGERVPRKVIEPLPEQVTDLSHRTSHRLANSKSSGERVKIRSLCSASWELLMGGVPSGILKRSERRFLIWIEVRGSVRLWISVVYDFASYTH